MNGVRTRKEIKKANGVKAAPLENGHIKSSPKDDAEIPENIFLFYPNLIGQAVTLEPEERD